MLRNTDSINVVADTLNKVFIFKSSSLLFQPSVTAQDIASAPTTNDITAVIKATTLIVKATSARYINTNIVVILCILSL